MEHAFFQTALNYIYQIPALSCISDLPQLDKVHSIDIAAQFPGNNRFADISDEFYESLGIYVEFYCVIAFFTEDGPFVEKFDIILPLLLLYFLLLF